MKLYCIEGVAPAYAGFSWCVATVVAASLDEAVSLAMRAMSNSGGMAWEMTSGRELPVQLADGVKAGVIWQDRTWE